MAIALCHTIPRDTWLRFSFLFAIIAFFLIVGGLSSTLNSTARWATLTYRSPVDSAAFRKVALMMTADLRPWATDFTEQIDTPQRICPKKQNIDDQHVMKFEPDSSLLPIYNANFSNIKALVAAQTDYSKCDIVNDAGIASAVLLYTGAACLFLMVFITACCVMRVEANTRVYVTFLCSWMPAWITTIAGGATYGAAVMKAAVDFAGAQCRAQRQYYQVGKQPECGSENFVVEMGIAYNALVSACVFITFGVLIAMVKLYNFRQRNKEVKEMVQSRADEEAKARKTDADDMHHIVMVEDRVEMRIVNDDWERQKQVLEQRREIVGSMIRNIKRQRKYAVQEHTRRHSHVTSADDVLKDMGQPPAAREAKAKEQPDDNNASKDAAGPGEPEGSNTAAPSRNTSILVE